jgi:glycosyltransferase involved in cell wall biosynthesis
LKPFVFLTPRFPWPLVGGDRVKSFHILRLLARRAPVHLITLHHGSHPTAEQIQTMSDIGVTVHGSPLRRYWSAVRAASSLWNGMPLEISFYNRRTFHRLVNEVIDLVDPSVVFSFFMRTAEYVRHRRDVPRILIAEDCRQLYQSRSASATPSLAQRLIRTFEVRQLSSYEPAVMRDFDVVTFVTQTDIDAMTATQPSARYALLSNGVDLVSYSASTERDTPTVLFAGKLNVEANHVMAVDLITSIWPMVLARMPDAKLVVAGSFAKPKLRSLMLAAEVQYIDTPTSLVPAYSAASVFAHPHCGASGIQNKVLEAMACGCAVVTTPTGLQGIDAVDGVHALVGSTHSELASHIVTLLSDCSLRNRLASQARTLMETTKSWQAIDEQLTRVLSIVGWKP